MNLVKPSVYDELYREEQFTKYECLLKLGVKLSGTVLDAGCGTGLLHEYMRSVLGELNAKYVCLDPDPGMLRVARNRVKSPLSILIEGYAEDLPLREEVFDAVLSITTWGALSREPRSLVELKRVTRRGGIIVVTGHPRTFTRQPCDLDKDFQHVGSCIDYFYVAYKK